jgi:hypothetical protein
MTVGRFQLVSVWTFNARAMVKEHIPRREMQGLGAVYSQLCWCSLTLFIEIIAQVAPNIVLGIHNCPHELEGKKYVHPHFSFLISARRFPSKCHHVAGPPSCQSGPQDQ